MPTLDLTLSRPQAEFLEYALEPLTEDLNDPNRASFVGLVSGVGAGKSYIGAHATARHLIEHPGARAFVTGPTDKMLQRSTLPALFEHIPKKFIKYHNQTKMEIGLTNGSICWYGSAHIPDNLRGPTLSWVWIDEAAMIKKSAFLGLLGRLRLRAFGPYVRMLCTTTPRGKNWFYDFFGRGIGAGEGVRGKFRLVRMQTKQNRRNLAPGYVEALEDAYEGNWAKQELEGEFVSFEGLVYPMWDEDVHIYDPRTTKLPDFRRVVAGVDFGWEHPSVIEVFGLDWDGHVWLIHEFYDQYLQPEELAGVAKEIQAEYKVEKFFCDWADPTRMDRFQRAGLTVEKANKEVKSGIALLGGIMKIDPLKGARFHVSADAYLWRKQVPMYEMASRAIGDDQGTWDKPRKQSDDAPDAGRYAVMGLERELFDYKERPSEEPLTGIMKWWKSKKGNRHTIPVMHARR